LRIPRTGGETSGGDAVLELDHQALRCLLADARYLRQPRQLSMEDGRRQLRSRHSGEDVHGQLRPHSRDRDQQAEELLLLGAGEAEQLQRILADVRVAAKLRPCAFRGHVRHRLQGEVDEVSDALDVEHCRIFTLFQDDTGEARDHFANLRARAARQSLRGWATATSGSPARSRPQMAAARASPASSRPGSGIPSTTATIRPTCCFSARPVPVTACLITLGAKLRTGTPACAAARMATPRACPSTSAEPAFFAW